MSRGCGTLQEQAAHSVMASVLMAGSNIQTENFHYWFRTFDLGACPCMPHAHQIICTHTNYSRCIGWSSSQSFMSTSITDA
jgi:hypothetical protein